MKRLWRIARSLVPCLLASACAAIQADSDYYRAADFAKLHTYAWMAESPLIRSQSKLLEISPSTVQRIRDAIERELASKSFERVAARDDADFVISFTVGARDTINIDDYPPYYRGDWNWNTTYYWPRVDAAMYTEGTLAIDVFDNSTREPIWHGWARKTIAGADIDDPEPTIKAAVAAILEDFPPSDR